MKPDDVWQVTAALVIGIGIVIAVFAALIWSGVL